MRYTLACDFIKELGYDQYGKPDVHVRTILVAAGLLKPLDSEFKCQKVITEIADAAGHTPYYVDKVIWLIGSGNFYNNSEIGKGGKVRGRRAEFIEKLSE